MRKHCYWPVISDLSNILSHRSVVDRFFTDPALMKMWTNVLAMFMCELLINWLYIVAGFEFTSGLLAKMPVKMTEN